MKTQYIVAAFCCGCAVAIAIAASSFNFNNQYCPNPSSSVAALCQTFGTNGNAVSRSEPLQIGLLLPYLQPVTEPETQVALVRTSNAHLP